MANLALSPLLHLSLDNTTLHSVKFRSYCGRFFHSFKWGFIHLDQIEINHSSPRLSPTYAGYQHGQTTMVQNPKDSIQDPDPDRNGDASASSSSSHGSGNAELAQVGAFLNNSHALCMGFRQNTIVRIYGPLPIPFGCCPLFVSPCHAPLT